jgi:hypothetical protein
MAVYFHLGNEPVRPAEEDAGADIRIFHRIPPLRAAWNIGEDFISVKLSQGEYTVIDRDQAENIEERFDLMRKALLCDVFLTSVNAISEDGILVNVDGVGNRTAAVTFGPKSVIAVVGMNKVCKTVDGAEARARTYAAPLNAARLLLEKTPCAATGSCGDCKSDECMCATIIKTRMCKIPGRITVILVGEPLGY